MAEFELHHRNQTIMLRAGTVGISLLAVAALLPLLPRLHAPRAMLVGSAALALIVTVIFGIATGLKHSRGMPLQLAVQSGVSCGVVLLTVSRYQGATLVDPILRLALATTMLAWVMAAAALLLSRNAPRLRAISQTVAFSLVLALTPLWAGGLVDTIAPSRWATDALIATSPLTYLAQAAHWDYLRSDWWYRTSPIGSLRFTYPNFWTATLTYGAIAVFLQAFACRPPRRVQARHDTTSKTLTI